MVGELINQGVTDDTKLVTQTGVQRYLNIGYRRAVNSLINNPDTRSFYNREADADLVADQKTYSLPTDLRKILRVEVAYEATTTFRLARRMDRNAVRNPQASYSTSDPLYFVVGDNIELNPTPSNNVTDGLRIFYVEDQADLSADGDTPSLPLGYHHIPVYYAVGEAKVIQGEPSIAQFYSNKFEVEVERMMDEVDRNSSDPNYVTITEFPDEY